MGHTRTLNFTKWQLDQMDQLTPNRSEYVRTAIREQLSEDYRNMFDEIKDRYSHITTVGMPDDLEEKVEKMIGITSLSFSEYARRAIQVKLEKETVKISLRKKNEEYKERNLVIIPGYNNGLPMKTRRLE